MKTTKFCVVALALAVLASDVDAQVTIEAFKDAGVFAAGFNDQGPPFATENNLGAHTHVAVGRANSDRTNRAFFQFDITGNVPSGSIITSATFEFDVTRQGGATNGQIGNDFSLHRVTDAWDEGSGVGNSGAITEDGVTWTVSTVGSLWATMGGDFDAATSGTVFVDGPTDGSFGGEDLPPVTYTITSAKLITDIQNIVDGTPDHGFVLKGENEEDPATMGSAARVGSREGNLAARLVIDFTTGSVLLGDVNLDGFVNLLDVQPFIALIGSGGFQAEADINEDGTVNLLDVQPFVDLLAGG